MSYIDGDVWLSGPDLADWVLKVMQQRGLRASRRGDVANLCRRVAYWAQHDYVRVDSADHWLCFLQIHPVQIPDEFWVRKPELPMTLDGRKALR